MEKSCRRSSIHLLLFLIIFSSADIIYAKEKVALIFEGANNSQAAVAGFINKKISSFFELKIFSLDTENELTLQSEVLSYEPSYMFLLGAKALKISAGIDKPAILTMFYNYQPDEKHKNVKWLYHFPSPKFCTDILGNIFENITMSGILYNPENNSLIAEEFFNYEADKIFFIDFPVEKKDNVIPNIESLKTKVQLIFGLPDSTIFNSLSINHLKRFTVMYKKPLTVFTNSILEKSGAFISFFLTPKQIAFAAVDLLNKLYNNETSVKQISFPETGSYTLNKDMIRILKLHIPEEIKKGAHLSE